PGRRLGLGRRRPLDQEQDGAGQNDGLEPLHRNLDSLVLEEILPPCTMRGTDRARRRSAPAAASRPGPRGPPTPPGPPSARMDGGPDKQRRQECKNVSL